MVQARILRSITPPTSSSRLSSVQGNHGTGEVVASVVNKKRNAATPAKFVGVYEQHRYIETYYLALGFAPIY